MHWRSVRGPAVPALAILALAMLLPGAVAAQNQDQIGQWTLLPYTTPINPIHVAVMRTGKILIAAGSENDPANTTYRAAVYDPRSGAFALQTVPWDLFCNAMSQLPDGRLLITGGTRQYSPFRGLRTTTIFDPATESFTQAQDMARGRWYPSNAALADGRTMVFSGILDTGSINNAVEQYSVASGWSPESLAPFAPPLYPWLHLLPNGRVFMAGFQRTTRMFDPATETWTTIADTNYTSTTAWGARQFGSSVLLPLRPSNGYRPRVMIMGGDNPATNTAEIIDLGAPAPAWRALPSMALPRVEMNAVILPTGQILALGGSARDNDSTTASLDAELFDPVTETWAPAGRAAVPRLYHSVALLLPDATVWVAGANPFQGFYDNRLEIYAPPYLFTRDAGGNVVAAARPSIGSAPARVGYNASFAVATPNAADIAQVVLIRPGSATHAFNFEQRLVELAFSAAGGGLAVTSPPNSNLAPPGHYMLFLIDRRGVPSMARFVQLSVDPVNQLPNGTITSPPGTVTIVAGQTVSFAGTGTDPDGVVTRHSWVFPSGSPASSDSATPGAVRFASPGTYVVSLTVADNDGDNDPTPARRTVVVRPAGFTASISTPPDGATVNGIQTVGMQVSGGGAAPFTYVLKVDGAQVFTRTTASTSASHGWNTADVVNGPHTLALQITDALGTTASASRTVGVDNASAMVATLASPAAGAQVAGTVAVRVQVQNGAGPFLYTLTVGNAVVGSQTSAATDVTIPWDTRTTADGPRTLVATVQTSTATVSDSANVTVQNGGAGALAAFVARFYSIVLGRPPDPVGLATWQDFLRGQCNAAGFGALARGFVDSPEFRARPLSVPELVSVLYRTFLGREPDATGLAGWRAVLRQARLDAALRGFIPSPEFAALLPDRTDRAAATAVIARFYTAILQRSPLPAELAAWVDYVTSTRDLETAAAAFLASEELEARPLTAREYVALLYRAFLDREPDGPGLDAWEAELRQALLDVIDGGFVSSPEFQGQRAQLC